MEITVYTKNNCPQCMLTKRFLDEHHLSFNEINLSDHPEEVDSLLAEGFQQAPVIKTSTGISFSGFQPDQLEQLL